MKILDKLTLDQLLLMLPFSNELEIKKELILIEIKKRITDAEITQKVNNRYFNLQVLGKELLKELKYFKEYEIISNSFYNEIINYEVTVCLENGYFKQAIELLKKNVVTISNENQKIFMVFLQNKIEKIIKEVYG